MSYAPSIVASSEYESSEEESIKDGPRDSQYRVYIIFYWLGIGTLLPWNIFIAVSGYWLFKFRDVDRDPDGTSSILSNLQLMWGPALSMSAMVPNVSVLLLSAVFGHKLKNYFSIIISLAIIVCVFILSLVMTKINTDGWQRAFFGVTLVSVIVFNAMVGIFQGGLTRVTGKFPHAYMGALIQGQALGGIIAASLNIIMLATGLNQRDSAFYDFIIVTVYLVMSLAAFLYVTKTEFYKFHVSEGRQIEDDFERSDFDENDQLITGPATQPRETSFELTCRIIVDIWVWILAVFLCFFVTLCVFPSLVQLVRSTQYELNTEWGQKYFIPVGCFLFFNVGDYLGRICASLFEWPGTHRFGAHWSLGLSACRLIFIPLFLYCNISPDNRKITEVAFKSDTVYLILMALFSFTNGYLGNICMTHAPKAFTSPRDQGHAASIMVFFLVFGLAIGSVTSLLIVNLL